MSPLILEHVRIVAAEGGLLLLTRMPDPLHILIEKGASDGSNRKLVTRISPQSSLQDLYDQVGRPVYGSEWRATRETNLQSVELEAIIRLMLR